MKITQQSTNALFLSTLVASTMFFGFAEAQDFQEIADVPQDAKSVIASTPICNDQIPVIMWTIETADSVTVSTSPPDLLTVDTSRGGLSFKWNDEVAATAKGGGVKIGFPSGQLGSLNVGGAAKVQISDGFTTLATVDISGASVLTADLTSNAVPMTLKVSGASAVTMNTGNSVQSGNLSGASKATIKASSLGGADISGASALKLDGDFAGGNLSGASTVTATGGVTGLVNSSGASNVNAASGCGMVRSSGASNCNAGTQTVSVVTTEQPPTMTGTVPCYGGSGGGWSDSIWSGSRSYSCSSVAAVAAGAAYLLM